MKVLICAYAGIILFFCACSQKSSEKKDFEFYYYPKTNVYYHPSESTYFYSLDSSRSWKLMQSGNANISPLSLGGKILINSAEKEIWRDNETHRSLYGGILYNILSPDTSYLFAEIPKKEITKNTPDSTTSSPRKKRNFFQRLFGKKKDKA